MIHPESVEVLLLVLLIKPVVSWSRVVGVTGIGCEGETPQMNMNTYTWRSKFKIRVYDVSLCPEM